MMKFTSVIVSLAVMLLSVAAAADSGTYHYPETKFAMIALYGFPIVFATFHGFRRVATKPPFLSLLFAVVISFGVSVLISALQWNFFPTDPDALRNASSLGGGSWMTAAIAIAFPTVALCTFVQRPMSKAEPKSVVLVVVIVFVSHWAVAYSMYTDSHVGGSEEYRHPGVNNIVNPNVAF